MRNCSDVARKLSGNCLNDSVDVARTPSRITRGLLRGRQPVCFVICGVDFSGNCQVTCEPLRQPWCGHSPALCEIFPANCSDTTRKLPGNCPDDSPDAARTAAVITKSFANYRANFGANFGADIHRRLVRRFPPTARTPRGRRPVIARIIRRTLRRSPRRMLRGNCAVVARLAALFFNKGMVSNQNTGFPIPESRQRFRSIEHLNLMRP